MQSDIEKILTCSHHDPFHYLGAHFSTPSERLVTLRTFQPHARQVKLLLDGDSHSMERIHQDGIFQIILENDGEWLPNCYGGKENLEAIEFLRHLNSIVYDIYPDTLLIAEESTNFHGVSKATGQGGLGFGFKWNMGWMNDILHYFAKDPSIENSTTTALPSPSCMPFRRILSCRCRTTRLSMASAANLLELQDGPAE